ncbi:alpha/beta fold hydrolase [Tundrisphaera lichenicola]|uniref:alpha/beta fold hydrolase n=1 Tax=Tundrisphaera lichenicola TaxID=2029860 RepID=UPI003EBC4600
MIEPRIATWKASDGYPIHAATWPTLEAPKGRVVILHGVQSHGGWYHRLGRTLAENGFEAHFPDRRGSGANRLDRGHTPSTGRLLLDVSEYLTELREREPSASLALAGISWGGKLAVATAARQPGLVDALALICPGLHPRVGVSRKERWQIALANFVHPRKTFPIPLSDPALFTSSHEGQTFIADDPLGLRAATARLLAASAIIDWLVKKAPSKIQQPALLMLAGQDRIVDNQRTLAYFEGLASENREVIDYPEGHHTLEFDPDPSLYALDLIRWLERASPSPS